MPQSPCEAWSRSCSTVLSWLISTWFILFWILLVAISSRSLRESTAEGAWYELPTSRSGICLQPVFCWPQRALPGASPLALVALEAPLTPLALSLFSDLLFISAIYPIAGERKICLVAPLPNYLLHCWAQGQAMSLPSTGLPFGRTYEYATG